MIVRTSLVFAAALALTGAPAAGQSMPGMPGMQMPDQPAQPQHRRAHRRAQHPPPTQTAPAPADAQTPGVQQGQPPQQAPDQMQAMPGMEHDQRQGAEDNEMHMPMSGGPAMSMTGALGPYAMTREASGTSWQPDASTHDGVHIHSGDWMLMTHALLNGVYDWQDGPRGGTRRFSPACLWAWRGATSAMATRCNCAPC